MSRDIEEQKVNDNPNSDNHLDIRKELLAQKRELEMKFATLKISDKNFKSEMQKVDTKLNKLKEQQNFVVKIDNDDSFISLVESGDLKAVNEKMKKENIRISLNEKGEVIEIE
ncbi:hypothetical protein ACFSO7_21810 [Bacillus sp. CGMCC 1.16607]|uniref:hypothetical protein n=1 Tax=Bacillus sp. CGMCC 1.16607 TaxID=3351842 RepID=UPI00362BA114